jgi:VanZ family protein
MLRYFKLWLIFGWLLVFAVCYLSLTATPPKFDITFEHIDKLEHMLAYIMLMGWFAQLYQTKQSRLFYSFFFILLGVVIEILQGMGQTRLFEYSDMLANTTGVLLALLMTKGKLKGLLLTFENKFLR